MKQPPGRTMVNQSVLNASPRLPDKDTAAGKHCLPIEVAVIGGGRWGKVLCKVLARSDRVRIVHAVSKRNFREMREWLQDQGPRIVLHGELDSVLEKPEVRAAFVANLPAEHFTTSKQLLEHGKHVLVEK